MICYVIIFAADRAVKDAWRMGFDCQVPRSEWIGHPDDPDFVANNSGPDRLYPFGPRYVRNGKTINTLCFAHLTVV